ncbi:unnamed protein product [Prorocentrum cordatum]|uniref:SET domain-containing protein n=1 Tax=Prorocentrum cordatum TaxID=2364126 RepID=A0ABN9YJ00_9DINO|nr:unnamed protein product [Polarella glacialis]CAK0910861.1 unnamed protein product [Polarella glacialis]
MAEIVCLVRHSGVDLFEAMAFFTRFAKMSWLNMVSVPSRSTCEPLPRRGPLAGIAQAKQGKRFKAMSESLEILSALLWEKRFAELLNIDFYSNLVGQFSLSNVWVRIEHPLASRLAECSKDESFKQRYGRLLEVATRAAKEAADDDDDEPPVDQKVDAGCGGWRLGRFEGSALFACMALSNHSCLPNFDMRFTDGAIATMVALRDVEEGGELHLAYVSPSKPLDERLATLWRTWGFVCTCRKCQDQLMARAVGEGGDTAGSAVPGGPPV